ncbi:hypothetical protein ACLX1H_009043 [Fusarium chlamydosporum]
MARKKPMKEHPTKVSSTLFHFATLIIHDLFHTDERDSTRLKNSSYLDLGPLYGNNEDEQKKVRTFKDGLLKKDTFAESRLLSQPPGVCALVIAFNRFHNYVVQELATINEQGRFSIPARITENDPRYGQAQLKRDNDLFQTGRLITCGLYVNVILDDYLRTILNLNRNPVNSDWKLDPREDFDNVFDKIGAPRGIGNQVSIEFNMIYRWHSAISAQDEKWTNDLFHKIFGADVNIVEALYGHPDNIELYPGLLAEDAKKPMVPGSGLCPGFTTSFAILSDAVALVRGDRFYSVDYNPSNLTSFGFNEASSDYDVAGGGVMYKLLMRAFPGWYRANSVFALYPFTTPEGNKEIFDKLGTSQDLDFNKPMFVGPPKPITTWQGVVNALESRAQFHVPWGQHTFQLTHHDYMLSGDSPANAQQRTEVQKCLYSPENGLEQVKQFYEQVTANLIRQNSRRIE